MASANYLNKLKLMPTWPARMRREVAALYVGPVSPREFDQLVDRGIMPKPIKQGDTPVWLKRDIDHLSDRLDGLASSTKEEWERSARNI